MNRSPIAPYLPQPICLDGIELGAHLTDLVEALARNAHDVWAVQRIADGWTLGTTRSDREKTHPCLVEYDDLPVREKVYDRKLVLSTIRAILAMGYTVSKNA